MVVAVGYGGQMGNYTDVESGLALMTYRVYSPVYCRFLTRDPQGYSGGISIYTGGREVEMAVLRASETTHKSLKELAETTGLPMQTAPDHAVETYRRTVFLEQLNRDFAALRADPQAWQEEQEERTFWQQTLADGLMNAT